MQDKLGEQIYHQNVKKIYEPLTDTIKNTSENLTNTFTETSIKNNKAIENLNHKVLEFLNDKGMIALYSTSSLVNLLNLKTKANLALKKDFPSSKKNDFLIHGKMPVTLYSNMLNFRDSKKSLDLSGDLLETMTIYKIIVDHCNLQGRKIYRKFAEEMNFDKKIKGRPSTRGKSLLKLLN